MTAPAATSSRRVRSVTVVTPIHNEEACIPELVERVERTMEQWREGVEGREWEHLACDDHSTDGSFALLQKLHETHPRLRVERNPRRSGQTGGFETGFRHAKCDWVVTMDADLQLFPEDIPLLLAPIEEGRLDLTNAIRTKRRHAASLIAISRLGNLLIRMLLTCPVADAASNFTALPAKLAKNLTLVENDHRYIIPILVRRGLDPKRVGDVDVRHAARKHGASKYKALRKAVTGFPELLRFRKRLKRGAYDLGAGTPVLDASAAKSEPARAAKQ
ncbi:MAG: glycosyltransferase family 2 protein [Planctomycetes bacterium]|nr:glycosyltransferase family 2 protein [Planctomycetota bacterium]